MKTKKVILNLMFGEPFSWLEQYLDNVEHLHKDGYYWHIYTPHKIKPRKNVEIIPMTLEDFDKLVIKYTGINPQNYMEEGRPHKLTSDMYPAYGWILQDYIKDFDYWGHTNWDVVYGDIAKFIPDSEIEKYQIWSDTPREINGVWTLYKNDKETNNLFREIPEWEKMFREHELFYLDETHFTHTMRKLEAESRVKWGYPKHYQLLGYDRFTKHKPEPQLEFKEDGALYEIDTDLVTGARVGREIPMFHFSYTKKWPLK